MPENLTPSVSQRPAQTWLDETRALLMNRPNRIRLQDIADATGVSVAWLSKLQTGKMPDASVNKVQAVNKWLRENTVNA